MKKKKHDRHWSGCFDLGIMRERKGFSLIENLLSLCLALLILFSSFEVFGIARDTFFKLNKEGKNRESAVFALDKIRIDLFDAGRGLGTPSELGLLEGLSAKNETLTVTFKEEVFSSRTDLLSGQTRVYLEGSSKIKKRRHICVFDSQKGEVQTISSFDKESVILASPLKNDYAREATTILLIKRISLFLDKKAKTLRRRVNSSSSQPLLEDVADFSFGYDKSSNLVKISITLESNKEKRYEISVFPKNLALANPVQ